MASSSVEWALDPTVYGNEYLYRGFLVRVRRKDSWCELWLLGAVTGRIGLFAIKNTIVALDETLNQHLLLLMSPSFFWRAMDGLPWELHAIEDLAARAEAVSAYKHEF